MITSQTYETLKQYQQVLDMWQQHLVWVGKNEYFDAFVSILQQQNFPINEYQNIHSCGGCQVNLLNLIIDLRTAYEAQKKLP